MVLAHLAPARRRLVLGIAGLVVLAVMGVAVAAWVTREEAVDPVPQDQLGPVLLVPGYGGSTEGFDVLEEQLTAAGRDVLIVEQPDGTGDLREQAERVDDVAREAVDDGAPSVDVVGYSAGGLVTRYWVAELGGDELARRVVTLASPHHGTDLAGFAGGLTPDECPEACQQLVPDSDLITDLNRDDETPVGPRWVAIWTENDSTVVPPSSGDLEGALAYAVQDVCPELALRHSEVPRSPVVVRIVLDAVGEGAPTRPGPVICEPD